MSAIKKCNLIKKILFQGILEYSGMAIGALSLDSIDSLFLGGEVEMQFKQKSINSA